MKPRPCSHHEARLLDPIAVVLLALLSSVSWQCGRAPDRTQANPAKTEEHDIDRPSMERSINPGDDFFRFANGAWLNKSEIPPDRSKYGVFSILGEQALQRTRELLEQAAANQRTAENDERKIGDYYASYLDEGAIEGKGT